MPERNVNKLSVQSIYSELPSDVKYQPEDFGYSNLGWTGRGVSICIVDSGTPTHKAITNIAGEINFTNSPTEKDLIGHSTIVSGIIGGNSEKFVGLAPDADLYFAKMVDDECRTRFDAFVAAMLWSVIREVDILVVPVNANIDNPALHDAIKKVYGSKVCIIASSGNGGVVEYPAAYNEVLSVGTLISEGQLAPYSAEGDANVIGEKVTSTYTDQNYAVISGSSVSTAIVAGLAARFIEQYKVEGTHYTPNMIYNALRSPLADTK